MAHSVATTITAAVLSVVRQISEKWLVPATGLASVARWYVRHVTSRKSRARCWPSIHRQRCSYSVSFTTGFTTTARSTRQPRARTMCTPSCTRRSVNNSVVAAMVIARYTPRLDAVSRRGHPRRPRRVRCDFSRERYPRLSLESLARVACQVSFVIQLCRTLAVPPRIVVIVPCWCSNIHVMQHSTPRTTSARKSSSPRTLGVAVPRTRICVTYRRLSRLILISHQQWEQIWGFVIEAACSMCSFPDTDYIPYRRHVFVTCFSSWLHGDLIARYASFSVSRV